MQFIKLMPKSEAEKDFSYHYDYITSTMAGQTIKLLGYEGSQFTTLRQTYESIINKRPISKDDNDRMLAGIKLETGIIDMFAHKFKCLAVPSKYVYSSVDTPHMADNPDGFVMSKEGEIEAVIEVKNIGLDQAHCWDNGVDPKYFWQGLHHSIFYGVPCIFAVLTGGNQLKRFFLDYKDYPQETEDLLKSERIFFDMIQQKTPPDIIEAKDTKTFNAIIPKDETVIELSFQDLDIENYLKAKEKLKELKSFVDKREAQYKELMKNNVKAFCIASENKENAALYMLSYSPVKMVDYHSIEEAYAPELARYKTEINWNNFALDFPNIIEAAKKPMTRRFAIRKKLVPHAKIKASIEKLKKSKDSGVDED
jgi:hypothetical protein